MSIPPPLQASKWISVQALLSANEMGLLMQELGEFRILLTTPSVKPEISQPHFLEVYESYCSRLSQGMTPDPGAYRSCFSSFWSTEEEAFVRTSIGDKFLCRAVRPVVQLQYHLLGFSPLDKKFRAMVMGKGSMPWGLQFSYPTLFQDRGSNQIAKVGAEFPNTHLFRSLRKWMRAHTIPTPFIVEGEVINAPMRIGREARSWINNHPQFQEYSLSVKGEACK